MVPFTRKHGDNISQGVSTSDSPWASSLHMVRKKDGGWRPWGSKTPEEQEDHLLQLFTILRENHLIINAKRCVFGKSTVSFLGHTVSSASISPLPSHVSAVSSFPHHVHIDIVGPLPPSGGFTHLLTMIDRTTNWPEYCLLSDTCSCALGFVST